MAYGPADSNLLEYVIELIRTNGTNWNTRVDGCLVIKSVIRQPKKEIQLTKFQRN